MNNLMDKTLENTAPTFIVENRFNRKPRWMSGMAEKFLRNVTAKAQEQKVEKFSTHGRRPRHI